MKAVARAQADLEAGRSWKARDRLRGAFVTQPANQEVLKLLGEVLYQMGDLPEAAKYWLMTDRTGSDFDAARAALLERHGGDLALVGSALPVRVEPEELPLLAQERLSEVSDAARARFGKHVDLGWGRRPRGKGREPVRTWRTKVGDAVGGVLVLLFVAAVLVGIVSLAIRGVEVVVSLFR
ncbi:MAG: DUF6584 family protein [Acidimicrobiales bacterium]